MSDLVRNLEDRFSHVASLIITVQLLFCYYPESIDNIILTQNILIRNHSVVSLKTTVIRGSHVPLNLE